MKLIIIALAIVLGSVGLHLLALWMERKGWIYYKHNQPSRSRLGNAFLEVQSILEPNKKHIIEIKKGLKRDNAEPGKGDDDSRNKFPRIKKFSQEHDPLRRVKNPPLHKSSQIIFERINWLIDTFSSAALMASSRCTSGGTRRVKWPRNFFEPKGSGASRFSSCSHFSASAQRP